MPTPVDAPSRFSEALSYLSPENEFFAFNDWAAIKDSLGASDVTSASSEEDKRQVMQRMGPRPSDPGESPAPETHVEALAEGFGRQNMRILASAGKFDQFDFEWEAVLGGPPETHVLRFREGFDFAPVVALFDEHGYASEKIGAGTLRTYELEEAPTWVPDLNLLSVGLLDDGRTMIASHDPTNVRAVLTRTASGVPDHLTALRTHLGEPWAAEIVADETWCANLSEPEPGSAAAGVLESAGPLSAWDAMGVGYSGEFDPLARIAFAYGNEADAAADLTGRRLVAEEGFTLIGGPPNTRYADTVFTVEGASADRGIVRLDVSPIRGWAGWLFTTVYVRDAMYAACS